jgi:hypothetical protein
MSYKTEHEISRSIFLKGKREGIREYKQRVREAINRVYMPDITRSHLLKILELGVMCYTSEEFIEQVKKLPRNSIIIYDEVRDFIEGETK